MHPPINPRPSELLQELLRETTGLSEPLFIGGEITNWPKRITDLAHNTYRAISFCSDPEELRRMVYRLREADPRIPDIFLRT